ncbi:MAG: hypothetical protein U0996_26340 [Planctomycetaceae bacterium]
MALKQKDEHFTHFTHFENGKALHRHLHRLEVQAADGKLYVVEGQHLPDSIMTYAGIGHRGEHFAQILMDPRRQPRQTFLPEPDPWPCGRDMLNFLLGIGMVLLLIMTLNFVSSLFSPA